MRMSWTKKAKTSKKETLMSINQHNCRSKERKNWELKECGKLYLSICPEQNWNSGQFVDEITLRSADRISCTIQSPHQQRKEKRKKKKKKREKRKEKKEKKRKKRKKKFLFLSEWTTTAASVH